MGGTGENRGPSQRARLCHALSKQIQLLKLGEKNDEVLVVEFGLKGHAVGDILESAFRPSGSQSLPFVLMSFHNANRVLIHFHKNI